jgi:hypothetical protein
VIGKIDEALYQQIGLYKSVFFLDAGAVIAASNTTKYSLPDL